MMSRPRFKIRAKLIGYCFLTLILNYNCVLAQDAKTVRIDKAGLLILIRQTLTALDLSNKTGNYSILREVSAPGFAAVNDAARLSRSFQNQRERNLDYSGVLAYEPQLTVGPEITKEGMLHFAGFFPSASTQIKFDMYFAPVNGQWKLFGLAADVGPSGLIAPMAQPQVTKPSTDNNKQQGPGALAPVMKK